MYIKLIWVGILSPWVFHLLPMGNQKFKFLPQKKNKAIYLSFHFSDKPTLKLPSEQLNYSLEQWQEKIGTEYCTIVCLDQIAIFHLVPIFGKPTADLRSCPLSISAVFMLSSPILVRRICPKNVELVHAASDGSGFGSGSSQMCIFVIGPVKKPFFKSTSKIRVIVQRCILLLGL